jgi:hypothetical protein
MSSVIPERYSSDAKTVSLGAVNFSCAVGDKAANLAKIEATLREASAPATRS